ncbi:MAG TPA: 2TM domain-containing protein [Actinomycetota bacterium]|nr:2TM domain-containing protein [Actinomycetota bacterium]
MTPEQPRAKDRRRRTHRQRAARAAGRLRSPRWLVLHAGLYLAINGFMVVTWLLSPDPATAQGVPPGVQQQFWPAWTMLLLAVPLGLHATVVLATRPARRPTQRPRPQAAPAPGLGGLGGQQPARAERALATVLFTDIVGSTQRAREVGPALGRVAGHP